MSLPDWMHFTRQCFSMGIPQTICAETTLKLVGDANSGLPLDLPQKHLRGVGCKSEYRIDCMISFVNCSPKYFPNSLHSFLVYLTMLGLSCSTQDLHCIMQDLSLWGTDSLVVVLSLSSWGTWLSCSAVCGILVPQSGVEPLCPALQGGHLTTGPPGKSPSSVFDASWLNHWLSWKCWLTHWQPRREHNLKRTHYL